MTDSTIAAELLKQLDKLPLEFQKKVLEFAKELNSTVLKGKPGGDLLKLAGTIDPESLKVMEEAVEYGCEKTDNPNLARIEQVIFNLPLQEQLELMEKMKNRLKEQSLKPNEAGFNWDEFYGIAKGIWNEDAQEYVNRLREDHEWI
jgi:DNA-binding protein YbaB